VNVPWTLGALIVAVASFVYGLAGFGIGLVSLALLPFVMSTTDAIVLTTIYAVVFALIVVVPLRSELRPQALGDLILGSLVGTVPGVWALAVFPASVLNRIIGLVLIAAVVMEVRGRYPQGLAGRSRAVAAGVLAGIFGGAVGTPGPPVILYAAAQGWSPRSLKGNLQAFFVANQGMILAGYWWAGLVTGEVRALTLQYAAPAAIGVGAGVALFNRVDHARFRQIVFALLFVSGLVLVVRG
jgi:hypothetical protein